MGKKIQFKMGFSFIGLILFALVMIPNIVWVFVPSSNDPLRIESTTPVIDIFQTIFQVLMIASLILLINKKEKKLSIRTPFLIASIICLIIYYINWVLYYSGTVNLTVLALLTIPPCLSFTFLSIDRKNWFACGLSIIFFMLHLTHFLLNHVVK
ncbi:hypothetical protein LJC17_02135 [Acholeplasma sp. OttesenSCG-928-E16]|nr:hypothetical protein [Acholeplasma sp. OttesenSCG-928-E16]